MAIHIDDNTDINYTVPVSPSDGNIIAINKKNDRVNLIFYQARKQTGDHLDKVDVIGAILMNIEDLKKYRDAINENLEQIEKAED